MHAAVACSVFLMAACSDENDDGDEIDPDTPFPHSVPTAQSMTADVSDLSEEGLAESASDRGPLAADGSAPGTALRGLCHAASAIAVIWINANVALRLAIPTAAFAASVQEDPVFVGDQTWRWTATGQSQGTSWTAELSGTIVGPSTVDWAMRISGTPFELDRFLWFDGQANGSAQNGFWHYYDPRGEDPTDETVRIDWILPPVGTADQVVTFENRVEGTSEFGDQLRYVYSGSGFTVELDDVSAGGRVTIVWNESTGNGSLTNLEGDQCCWGPRPTFDDLACP